MEYFIKLVESNNTLTILITIVLSLCVVMILTFFIQYNIDRMKGRHAKFLWFEVNKEQKTTPIEIPTSNIPNSITGKNINMGENYGNIGDQFTGIKQRQLTESDFKYIQKEIERFSISYAGRINKSHITIGYPGCKETTRLAQQLYVKLKETGSTNIQMCYLQTFGAVGKKFGVSNAPDDSVMIEIFPADNVE